ncbi:PH domain-containing protein [Haloterrigena salifodinae]|uniref:PH domain-containing protein n=1 Tax=Haloterrigena salifodinae TaxID=2675099 RepID=A0A8T8E690_9EURY|nr:PH domain-containing protein [Haloterrigena salifodinae]
MPQLNKRIVYVWTIYLLLISIASGGVLRVLQSHSSPISRTVTVAVPGIGFVVGFAYLFLHYRSWNVTIRDDELSIQRGVIRRKETFIPCEQIQHIDVEVRLIERVFGLSRLVVYTAGSPHSDLSVPGLDSNDANTLREQLSRGGADEQ